jgi:MoxR-like ATPase
MATTLAQYAIEKPASVSDMFATPQTVQTALRDVGYNVNDVVAHTIFFGSNFQIPVLQEGPAGAGKTEMALALSRASGMKLVRLQCYEGITDGQAIGEFSKALQDLFVLLSRDSGQVWNDNLVEEIMSRKFFVAGPLLKAIESEERVILLIDEIDKIPMAFEAMLLELLSAWQLSIPGIGTVSAKTIPFTILTSNGERTLGDALRRRSLYLLLEAPTALQQAEIVHRKSPNLSLRTILFISSFAQALQSYTMKKPPAISEMNHLAMIMDKMGWYILTPEQGELVYPVLIKRVEDLNWIKSPDQFAAVLNTTKKYMVKMMKEHNIPDLDEAEAEAADAYSPNVEHVPQPLVQAPEVANAN